MTLAFHTPAKVNLALRILRKRPDGYHELETLLQMVDLRDRITLTSQMEAISIECDREGIPRDETNLAHKAARLLRETVGKPELGVRIRLEKHIPAGGGLGGGSGNAAGVLLGLNHLWNLNLPRLRLMELAARLGSDAPFFLFAPTAIGRGRGELLQHLPTPRKFGIVLVNPRFPIATAWVYSQLNLALTKPPIDISILQNFLADSNISGVGANLSNDLESVVIPRYPVIAEIKGKLLALGARGALLSGSGSTVFGIFDDVENARRASQALAGNSWDVYPAETIERLDQLFPAEILPPL